MTLSVNQIYQGNCLELMKEIEDESVDMILTDPPYGMDFQSNRRKNKYNRIIGDCNLDWIDKFTEQSYRVSKNNSAHYVFCSFHNIDIFKQSFQKKFIIKNILIWEKNNTGMGDLEADFAPKIEFILFLMKGRKTINGNRDPNILRFNKTGNIYHPTQKPIELFEYLLSKFSAIEEVILDPFAGSGTTGVACVMTNRKYILIEKDEKYCEIARKRIEEIPTRLL